jgi:ABC-type cobalamin/Fe3+-siderophores transport system ATPase subunit
VTLTLDALSLTIHGHAILNGVTGVISDRSLTCLVGPNGAGKTTLLRILAGELSPTSGRFLIDDTDACSLAQREVARHFSVIPQGIQPPPHLTVLELVTLGRFHPYGALWRWLTEQDRTIVQASLMRCEIDRLSKRRVEGLSGGEQKRAWLAFGLAQKKRFLLLDETLDGLDLPAKRSFFRLLKELAAESRGVLLTTHDLDLVTEFADTVVVMGGGSVKYEGPPVGSLETLLWQEAPPL